MGAPTAACPNGKYCCSNNSFYFEQISFPSTKMHDYAIKVSGVKNNTGLLTILFYSIEGKKKHLNLILCKRNAYRFGMTQMCWLLTNNKYHMHTSMPTSETLKAGFATVYEVCGIKCIRYTVV